MEKPLESGGQRIHQLAVWSTGRNWQISSRSVMHGQRRFGRPETISVIFNPNKCFENARSSSAFCN
jgi:hypothetical protein